MNPTTAARTDGMLQAVSVIIKSEAMITAILFGTVLVILQNLLCSAFVSLSILRRKSSENVCGFFASCKMASESSLETASRSALLKLFSAIIAFSPK